jgi:tellurite resistance protein TerC
VVERSLSLDNLFLFLLILGYFQVPDDSRRKVIVWGIAAALLLRAAAITAGVALVETLQPVVYVLGAALVYLAYRVLRGFREEFDPLRTPFVRAVRRLASARIQVRVWGLLYRAATRVQAAVGP